MSHRAIAVVHSTNITKSSLAKSTYYLALAIDGLFTKTGMSTGAQVVWNFRYEFPCTPATIVRFRIVKTSMLLNDVEAGEGSVSMGEVYGAGGGTGTVAIKKKREIVANLEYDLRLAVEAPVYQYQYLGGQPYGQVPLSMIQPVSIMIGDYQKGFNPPPPVSGAYNQGYQQPSVPVESQKGYRQQSGQKDGTLQSQVSVVNRTIGLDDVQFLSLIYRTADGVTEVHNCRLLSTSQPATVKITHCSSLDKFNSVQKEGMIMCRMAHDNICKCFESLLDNRGGRFDHWLVMEYIDGVNLGVDIQRRAANRQQWSDGELKRHTSQLIDAFSYMQSLSISHSDIKPDNLVISSSGVIKVIDFGLSLAGYQNQFERAAAFRVGGTPNFFSPVQFEAFKAYREGRNPQSTVQHNPFKSDVYALGLAFLSMATLQFIEGLNDPGRADLQQVLTEQVRTVPGGAWLKDVLSAMLVVDEQDRADFAMLKKLGYANSE